MKKWLIFAVLILIGLFVPGCTNKLSDANYLNSSIDGAIKIKDKDKEYECNLQHTAEQVNRLEITKPENIAGLTFIWEGESYKVLWKDLSCELNKKFLPQGAFAEVIINILNLVSDTDSLNLESDDGSTRVFTGKSSFGKFKLCANNDGTITNISVPDESLEVTFTAQD